MPSTFTTSGVELIADGEQSGAWGQTTNVNLQIIDRMTSQAGTITLSGTTHTLTVSNGILSDGQYNVLVFAGSPSGTNTVTVNPNTAQRTFFVRNTTAQSVVLTQGSGGNVTVPSNTSKVVYTNGTGAGAAVFDITNTVAANVTGNAGTATALQTARTLTIGSTGKAFDGTANVAWTLSEIGVNNATLTLATSGIATGSQTFTANQGTNATFTVNVPATNLTYSTAATTGTVNSSTGTNATIPAATTSLAGLMTNTDKTKLDGIAAGAQVNVATNLGYTGAATTGTVTSSTGTSATLPAATTSVAGLLTGTDKTKLDGIAAGAQVNVATNLGSSGTGGTRSITSSTGTGTSITYTASDVGAQASNAQLTALAGLATNGVIARTGTNTVAARTLTAGTGISITNGDGVSGNPTISATATGPVAPTAGTNIIYALQDATVSLTAANTQYVATGFNRFDSASRHLGVIVLIAGVIRCSYELRRISGNQFAEARIIKNGSNVQTNSTASTSFVAFSADVSVAVGDIVIFQSRGQAINDVQEWRNLRILSGTITPAVA